MISYGRPFRDFRNFDQHRENPAHPEVWTVRMNQPDSMLRHAEAC